MGVFDGIVRKFTVLKNEDIEKYLDEADRSELSRILWKVDELRLRENKSINVYLVVNIDEPYAPNVVELMKANGQWGIEHDPNQVEALITDGVLQIPSYNISD